VMAHCLTEVEEMAGIAGALVLNIGTLQEDWVESMICAAKAANRKGIPVILDPVGAGATTLRTAAVRKILDEVRISILRGNASEVLSLVSEAVRTRGVDSSVDLTASLLESAKRLAGDRDCIVAISGAEDLVTDGHRSFRVSNGHPLMTRVTGLGCGLSAVVGAFASVADGELLEAAAAAFGFYGLCGELAFRESQRPGSFFVAFVDALYAAGAGQQVEELLRIRQGE
ncbi:MAG TPA: hydroxyethylthiazole kinase, partial [Desulfuromonadales bacterium]|nr:hydroxyethylthiazole kinase [Desulfuromonadales bacterium]